jgi:hypothetical protein
MDEIEVEQVEPEDDELLEEWVRVTDEQHILGVCAERSADSKWPWRVAIFVAEYIRAEPLQSKLHKAITAALNGVPGVTRVMQEDREVWVVQGDVAGESLVRACSKALDRLAAALRRAYTEL